MAEIYALIDPRTEEVRYIGKANSSQKRFAGHLRESRRKYPVYAWIQSLRAQSLIPRLQVLEVTDNWIEAEKRWIESHRPSGRLLNVADGGDEPYCSPEVRAENGRRASKIVHSDPRKKRLWCLKKELGVLLKQGYVMESTKEKMRYAARIWPHLFGDWAAI